VQVAALKARVAEYTARYAAAAKFAEDRAADRSRSGPAQPRLRDHQEELRDLVGGKQSAVMSGELDVASGVADFRLIDPPRVSPKPVSPNRLALLPLALVAAIGRAGGGVRASQLRPVFSDANELRAKTGLPLLGVVSMALGDDRRRPSAGHDPFYGWHRRAGGMFVVGLVAMAFLPRMG
jgi:hypothetical protein